MKQRHRTVGRAALVVALAGSALALPVGGVALASASPGPSTGMRVQVYAAKQTQLLYAGLDAATNGLSPKTCQRGSGPTAAVTFLPVNWRGGTDATVSCSVVAGDDVVVDLGGSVANEDPIPPCGPFPDGFPARELVTIMRKYLPPSRVTSTATFDGRPIKALPVITPVMQVHVQASYPGDGFCGGLTLYQESVDLGHPGRLAAVYSGKKGIVSMPSPGSHVLVLDLSFGGTHVRTLTFQLTVS
jgi:hypothetical protein